MKYSIYQYRKGDQKIQFMRRISCLLLGFLPSGVFGKLNGCMRLVGQTGATYPLRRFMFIIHPCESLCYYFVRLLSQSYPQSSQSSHRDPLRECFSQNNGCISPEVLALATQQIKLAGGRVGELALSNTSHFTCCNMTHTVENWPPLDSSFHSVSYSNRAPPLLVRCTQHQPRSIEVGK